MKRMVLAVSLLALAASFVAQTNESALAMQCNGLICGCSGSQDCRDMKKAVGGQRFCGKYSKTGGSNDYGRTPGTWGCISRDPASR
jgi:hypothetical protein